MDKKFQVEYKKLNVAQRQAVDAIDGPVLVVAGPGTGKTQLLGMRVANILKLTDTDASNILCLTFTNKAATNMRERLNGLIGPSSRGVVVRTFHSFAAELMNMYPDYFWSGARLLVAPDAVQLEIIRGILASLPLDNPLASTFAGAFTQMGDVQSALKLAKEAGLTPDELRSALDENLIYIEKVEPKLADLLTPSLNAKTLDKLQAEVKRLPDQKTTSTSLLPLSSVLKDSLDFAIQEDEPTGKTKYTGKWKSHWIQTIDSQKGMFAERKRNNWWLAVADAYENYREQLHGQGYYDYNDMLIEVLSQLEKNPDMLADVQERFLYVLIDEFQDTNAAQLRLAHLVADHYAANNRPNLMAVGDDDQSIFAFNGAELSNMLDFKKSYPDTKLIVLTDNYRSDQAVLDLSKQIIEQAEDRLVKRESGLTKNLVAISKPKAKALIEHISYPTRQHQQLALAKRINEIWQAGETSVAVLARNHDSLQQLASILVRENVPISYERRSNVLAHTAVKHICLLAKLTVSIAAGDKAVTNVGLSELVRHPMWRLNPKQLWQLATSNYSSPDWLGSLLIHEDENLQAIGNWLSWLARGCQSEPLPLIMEYILGLRQGQYLTSPFAQYYLANRALTSEYLETLSAIELLRQLVAEFQGTNHASLADFVRFVDLNLSTGRVIADQSWFNAGQNAVQLLTVYKAKGLEFDNVFLIDANEDMWRPRGHRRGSPANLRLEAYGEKYDDYVRLLYVAASRAKSTFIATSYFTGERGDELLPTPLLSFLPVTTINQPTESTQEVLETGLRWPGLKTADEQALLRPRLENFSLNPSSLIDFLNVAEAGPTSFFERHLLRLPRHRSAAGSFGTSVHAALETAQRLVNTSKIDIRPILDRFETTLSDEHLPPLDFEQYLVKGEGLLRRLFGKKQLVLKKGGLTEQKLSDILLGEAHIDGKLDRVDLPAKGQVLISDYKTGSPLTSLDTRDSAKAVKAWRNRMQMAFYCLLIANSGRYGKSPTITSQLVYVESEKPSQMILSYDPSREELLRLELLIQAVWRKTMVLDFPDTHGYCPNIQGIRTFEQDLIDGKI